MRKGFTLVELAIVIIIVGLLVVGTMAGRSLIKSSEIKKIISGVEELGRAYNTFQAKFGCLPGDCSRAEMYLGSGVMNGNGDDEITPFADGADLIFENLLAFEHMGTAGFYKNFSSNEDCYFNASITDMTDFFRDCNYTIPSMNTTLFMYSYSDFEGLTNSYMPFACVNTTIGCFSANTSSSMNVDDVRQIDLNLDDGQPLKGRVLSACTTEINSFEDYIGSDIDLPYDSTRSSCPIIIKF